MEFPAGSYGWIMKARAELAALLPSCSVDAKERIERLLYEMPFIPKDGYPRVNGPNTFNVLEG